MRQRRLRKQREHDGEESGPAACAPPDSLAFVLKVGGHGLGGRARVAGEPASDGSLPSADTSFDFVAQQRQLKLMRR